jgi:hypothetical protein
MLDEEWKLQATIDAINKAFEDLDRRLANCSTKEERDRILDAEFGPEEFTETMVRDPLVDELRSRAD